MEAQVGANAESGHENIVRGTAGKLNDTIETNSLGLEHDSVAEADASYRGAAKRVDKNDVAK